MNLIWHIIKKDLLRVRAVLAVWAVTGIYLVFYQKAQVVANSTWDNLGIMSLITHFALGFALIAAIVQEDELTETNVFWRTRPVSPGRLLAAKSLLALTLFFVIPMAVMAVQVTLRNVPLRLQGFSEGGRVLLALVFACMAAASCSKDMGRYLLFGIFALLVTSLLTSGLSRFAPKIPRMDVRGVTQAKLLLLPAISVLSSAGILYAQYFKRRQGLAMGIMVAGITLFAVTAIFWTAPFSK